MGWKKSGPRTAFDASDGLALDLETDEARALGVFGSPTFAVGAELFWGDDHLEDAVQWARQGRLGAG